MPLTVPLRDLGGGRLCTARHQIASSAREAIVCIYSNHACSNGNIYLYTLYCAFQEVLMHLLRGKDSYGAE